jgi:3-dehydroquinate dehydratase type I
MICIPITAPTTREALEKMEQATPLADLLELRVDLMPENDLKTLLRARRIPVLVTNRLRTEGGRFMGSEEERLAILLEAVQLGADYVDIEAATDSELKDRLRLALRGTETRLIVSWHDFSGTPSRETLHAKLAACRADSPAIVKLVTTANVAADCLRLLELIPAALGDGQPIAAFCMGEAGKISRIMAPRLGSAIGYASLDVGEGSAPGQFTIAEMRTIFGILGDSHHPSGEHRQTAPAVRDMKQHNGETHETR